MTGPGPGASPADEHINDQGMQAERTRLAWSRTALALAVIGALEIRIGRVDLPASDRLPGVLMFLLALAWWVYGGYRYRSVHRAVAAGRPVTEYRQSWILAALAILPAAIATWSILV